MYGHTRGTCRPINVQTTWKGKGGTAQRKELRDKGNGHKGNGHEGRERVWMKKGQRVVFLPPLE
jgi:hypothetical protein